MAFSPHAMIGARIGNYRVVRLVGQGGMGAVYEAVHDPLGRRAAIKVLLPAYSQNEDMVVRFFNEARAVNIVEHPGIVNTFELGQLEDGTVYVIMEFLEGQTLTQRMTALAQRPVADTLRLCRQIASALAAAHKKGVVHRDLKPDNIMIIADPDMPGGERTKVLDFGVAKIAEEHHLPSATKQNTRSGLVLGTPRYMAPEQCRGAGGITDKADVYSLGVILYQLLSGRPPFCDEAMGDLLVAQMQRRPPPLRELAPQVPAAVAELTHAMLAKAAGDRPSMPEVITALERLEAVERAPRPAGQPPALPVAAARQGRPAPPSVAVSPSMFMAPVPDPADRELDLAPGWEEGAAGAEELRLPRRPFLRAAAALVLCLGLGGAAWGAWLWQRSTGKARGAEEASQLLQAAQRDVDAERWQEARDRANEVLALAGLPEGTRQAAQALQERAQHQLNMEETFARFRAALERRALDEAVEAYQALPEDAPLRRRARPDYERLFPSFASARLARARAARAGGRCAEFQGQLDPVLRAEPRYGPALRLRERGCTGGSRGSGEEDIEEPLPPTRLEPLPPPPVPVGASVNPAPAAPTPAAPAPVPPAAATPASPPPSPPPSPSGVAAKQPARPAAPAALTDEESNRLLREAQSLFQGGRYQRAIEVVRPLTVRQGSWRDAWMLTGTSACKLGDADLAFRAYLRLEEDLTRRGTVLKVCEGNGLGMLGGSIKRLTPP
jgi:tetratricopeptide (TPR) repeat protein